MMKLQKNRVSLALSLALTGGIIAGLPGTASAQSGVVGVIPGNVLQFPYYTANGGWQTLYNITNTSSAYLAVKVRFREQENSRDVLDFNVVMSPKDVWTAWVTEGPNGPRLLTDDTTCTSPILPKNAEGNAFVDFQSVAYTGASSDGGSTGIERAAEGHLEVYIMGAVPGVLGDEVDGSGNPLRPTAYWSNHDHQDCSIVDSNFRVDSAGPLTLEFAIPPGSGPLPGANALTTPQTSLAGDPRARVDFSDAPAPFGLGTFVDGTFSVNALKGNISFINFARGVGAGSTALTYQDFGFATNLVTAQEFPYFLEPTLGSDILLWGWDFPTFATSGVINEWSVNPDNGAATDWVVMFPDKYLHVDIYNDIQAGVNPVRLAWAGFDCIDGPLAGIECGGGVGDTLLDALLLSGDLGLVLFPYTEPFIGQSCDDVEFVLFDREENGTVTGGTSISPAPPVPGQALCYETNVITFGGAQSVLDSRLGLTIDTSGLPAPAEYGWLEIRYGLPKQSAGFAMKQRDFGDPGRNFGQLMDHSYGALFLAE